MLFPTDSLLFLFACVKPTIRAANENSTFTKYMNAKIKWNFVKKLRDKNLRIKLNSAALLASIEFNETHHNTFYRVHYLL